MNQEDKAESRFVRAFALSDLPEAGCRTITLEGRVIVVFQTIVGIFAVDNRCPHMGFPLDRGSVKDGILTCHWHHARFDLASGGTFDQWADDVRVYPVEVRNGAIWIDLAERGDARRRHLTRLGVGLERDIPLVIAKSVIALDRDQTGARQAFRAGLQFGTRNRRAGWGSGLTILTCMMNLLPHLAREDRPRAMYHGLSAVAEDSAGQAPLFTVRPLPGECAGIEQLTRWFRSFVELRDSEGAERCIVSAVQSGAKPNEMAAMMFAAATDHRYNTIGHVLDFTNKAFEALDHAGWDLAEQSLASLASSYANADRMEESNSWRNPVDLVAILERAFESLPSALEAGRKAANPWRDEVAVSAAILGEDPQAIADSMLNALREGCAPVGLGGVVAHAAALRIARFALSNEFGDWDTAHHSFTFANAVHQALLHAPTVEVLRGAFDAAMSVYLTRFLNVPPARIREADIALTSPFDLAGRLADVLDRQQQVDAASSMAASYLHRSGDPRALLAAIGGAMLREDRDFHTIQSVEAAFRQYSIRRAAPGEDALLATVRYLAAHSPTVRAQRQTYQIALKLSRGEKMFAEEAS
ncbi:MAG TPA: Rieske (2Fe-2S) protein [Candidatus Binataceae bacterium]|nr:Rieske (2Fe-2S) protein [Candidatus Binataceae bacterium]